MALIKCVECGAEISDKAPACPKCGNPMIQAVVAPSGAQQTNQPATGSGKKLLLLVGLVVFFFVTVNYYGGKMNPNYEQQRALERTCDQMIADSALGNERRMTRQMCDEAKSRNK